MWSCWFLHNCCLASRILSAFFGNLAEATKTLMLRLCAAAFLLQAGTAVGRRLQITLLFSDRHVAFRRSIQAFRKPSSLRQL